MELIRKPSARLLTLACAAALTLGAPAFAWAAASDATASAATAPSNADVVAANIDTSVDPAVDFFEFANGAWLKAHPIPASESSYGIGKLVQEDLYAKQRSISEQAAATRANAAAGSDERKIGDFWATATDEALAEKLGLQPLQADLQKIDAISNRTQVLDEAFALQRGDTDALFGFGIGQDEKDSNVLAVQLWQGGLGLPNRDYYFNDEPGIARARAAYVEHLGKLLVLLGVDQAEAAQRAQAVMAFETELAKVSRPLADLRDPYKNYNRMSPAELTAKYTPEIDWSARLAAWNLHPEYVIVGQPEFFSGLQKQLDNTPLPVLQDYLRLGLVDAYAPYLSKAFSDESFDFRGRALRGQQEQRPRWKRALDSENSALGMILGRIYVKEYFPDSTRQRYQHLVEAVRDAYAARIDKLDWMSAETKTRAHQKLASITPKVGYPQQWKDYSTLQVGTSSWAENVRAARRWEFDDELAKFGKPIDRSEWDMTPQTYNAYYNPSNNEIVLPAAMLSIPGFRDEQLDDAVVYGYVAASTIGHEITHGFDDQGRQFDNEGNLKDWWTAGDAKGFQQRAEVLAKQFDAVEPIPGIHINGSASLGENIADYGGIQIGLDAFKQTEQYREGKSIAGYTPLQRFFLGYALGWLFQQREQSLRNQLLSDVHAPAKWRVNVPMSNVPEFYEAFNVKPGQPMWRAPEQRVHIW